MLSAILPTDVPCILVLFRLLPHIGADGDPGQDAQPLDDGLALLGGVGCQGGVPGGVPFVAGAVRRVLSRGIFHVAQSQRLLASRWPLVAGLRPGAAGADGKGTPAVPFQTPPRRRCLRPGALGLAGLPPLRPPRPPSGPLPRVRRASQVRPGRHRLETASGSSSSSSSSSTFRSSATSPARQPRSDLGATGWKQPCLRPRLGIPPCRSSGGGWKTRFISPWQDGILLPIPARGAAVPWWRSTPAEESRP